MTDTITLFTRRLIILISSYLQLTTAGDGWSPVRARGFNQIVYISELRTVLGRDCTNYSGSYSLTPTWYSLWFTRLSGKDREVKRWSTIPSWTVRILVCRTFMNAYTEPIFLLECNPPRGAVFVPICVRRLRERETKRTALVVAVINSLQIGESQFRLSDHGSFGNTCDYSRHIFSGSNPFSQPVLLQGVFSTLSEWVF